MCKKARLREKEGVGRRGLSVDTSFSAGGGKRRSLGRQKTRGLPKQDVFDRGARRI